MSSKKAWLQGRFEDGLVFLKSEERGKCFIEYIPAENAWNPIIADDYMYINCLWVAGSFKGHGYGADLLNACIEDSKNKGKKGICILSSKKKKTFLADPKFLKYKGFEVCDEADNGIQLWYLPFDKNASLPKFKTCAKHPCIEEMGYVLYYTSQCPFNAKYVPIVEEVAKERGVQFKAIHLQSKEETRNAPTPITTYFCKSENFRKKGERKITFEDYYQIEKKDNETPMDFVKGCGWEKEISQMLIVDFLILNRDRHGANIEVIMNHKGEMSLAPLFDQGISFMSHCHSDEEIENFDVLKDRPVQSFVGSNSTKENLQLVEKKYFDSIRHLKEEDREYIFAGLDEILTEKHIHRIWEMIWKRWSYYESLFRL